jgi:two-component system response regulator FixJ
MTSSPIVHLIDDDAAIRDALTLMFQSRGFRVRAHRSALEFLQQGGRRSGCVVADMHMPQMTGVDLLTRMREKGVALPVIIITAAAGAPLALAAMRAGASDLLEKPFDDETLLASVRRALSAERGAAAPREETRAALARFATLSPRERDVLALLAEGKPNKEIARALGLGVRTVELCRANIMAKANIGTLVELVRLCFIAETVEERRASAARAPSRPRRRRSSLRGAAAA